MATIKQLTDVTNPAQRTTLEYLAEHLPATYLLLPEVKLNPDMGRFIDLLIIAPHSLINVEVKGWPGLIQGAVDAERVQVREEYNYLNPRHQAQAQREALKKYLYDPAQAKLVFEDPRVIHSLNFQAVVIFPHPEADVQLEKGGDVPCLTLSESVAHFTNPDFEAMSVSLSPEEQNRLADLLLPQEPQGVFVTQHNIFTQDSTPPESVDGATLFDTPPEKIAPTFPPSQPVEPPEPEAAEEDSKATGGHKPVKRLSKVSVSGSVLTMIKTAMDKTLKIFTDIDGGIAVLEGGARGYRVTQHDMLRELQKAMDKHRQPTLKLVLVHNRYTIALATADYEQISYFVEKAQDELSQSLTEFAKMQGYELLGAIIVTIVEDETFTPRALRVTSEFDKDVSPPKVQPMQILRPGQQRSTSPYLEAPASGKKFELDRHLITIGRHQDNTIALANIVSPKMVSRHHAHIKQEGENFVLYDGVAGQASRNGTFVNGQAVSSIQGHILQDGQRIILGAVQRVDTSKPLGDSLELIFRNPQAL